MKEIICVKCNVALQKERTKFSYLNHEMNADVLKCPCCGQVYLSEEMVKEKIVKAETSLEDK